MWVVILLSEKVRWMLFLVLVVSFLNLFLLWLLVWIWDLIIYSGFGRFFVVVFVLLVEKIVIFLVIGVLNVFSMVLVWYL